MALRAQLEADKEKEETEKRFPRQDQASQEIESAKKLRLLERNKQHAIRAPPWLNGSTSTMRDWRSWVRFPWVTFTLNVDIA